MIIRAFIQSIIIGAWVVETMLSGAALAGEMDDVAALDAFTVDWKAAYEAGDFGALSDLYETDARLMTRHTPAFSGRDAIIGYFAAAKASGGSANISFDLEERVIDGDYAFETAKWRLVVTGENGAVRFRDAGRSFLVFKRGDDGKWRVWRDMDNHTPDVPIETAPQQDE